MAGSWIASHLWTQYEFTQDKQYLAETAYPLLKGNAQFILDFLAKDPKSGYLMTGPSISPENWFRTAGGEEMVASMAENPIVLPMANPVPEILPDKAKAAGAAVVGTGRSDYPNQINNVLAFPGIFRGALDCRASEINEEMKVAAARAIASLVSDDELSAEYILPKAFDDRIGKTVAKAVYDAAVKSGVARI